jgi:hypothetical protein
MINVDQTVRSYSGRPGCMCGCRGNYSFSVRARKIALKQLLSDPQCKLQIWRDEGCVYVQTATRNRVLYLTAEGVAAARAMGIAEG